MMQSTAFPADCGNPVRPLIKAVKPLKVLWGLLEVLKCYGGYRATQSVIWGGPKVLLCSGLASNAPLCIEPGPPTSPHLG